MAPAKIVRRGPGRPPKPPVNPSRAAGAPTQPSVAATRPNFYSPDASVPTPAPQVEHPAYIDPAQLARTQAAAQFVEDGVSAESLEDQYEPGENLEADIARIRAMSRPLGVQVQKLALPKRPGYHTHWFNDEGGRIDAALNSGWTNRKGSDGKPLKRPVGFGRDKGVLHAFAMDIPEVFWLQDMDARNQLAADKMDSLKASPFQSKPGQSERSDAGKFYSPVEGQSPIQMERH